MKFTTFIYIQTILLTIGKLTGGIVWNWFIVFTPILLTLFFLTIYTFILFKAGVLKEGLKK